MSHNLTHVGEAIGPLQTWFPKADPSLEAFSDTRVALAEG